MEFDPAVHSLKCPKCGHGMYEVTHESVVIDRCTHCEGLWFDGDEAEELKLSEDSEDLDTGDPVKGWKYDSRADIDCPRCGKPMEKSSDPKQIHIWYEVCPEHGRFLDAGEFTDYKHETLLDFFRGIIKGRRGYRVP